MSDEQIAKVLDTSSATVGRVRQRFVEEGLEAALTERPRRGQTPKLSGRGEAQLIAVACSEAPEGQARWSLRRLADQAVELGLVETISHETVRRVLKKTSLSTPLTKICDIFGSAVEACRGQSGWRTAS